MVAALLMRSFKWHKQLCLHLRWLQLNLHLINQTNHFSVLMRLHLCKTSIGVTDSFSSRYHLQFNFILASAANLLATILGIETPKSLIFTENCVFKRACFSAISIVAGTLTSLATHVYLVYQLLFRPHTFL